MLRITGGKVYDPANGIDGEVKDLFIDDGRIVADRSMGGRTIDATGMIVFPGGVDVHTHVAGGAINFARAMTPEDHRRTQAFIRTKTRRSGLGGMAPTTFATGYLYAGMGLTTVNEAAVPVLSARHTHEELADIPIVDKSSLTLMANNEIMLDQLEKGEYERAKQVVAWFSGRPSRTASRRSIRAAWPPGSGARTPSSSRADRRLQQADARRHRRRSWRESATSSACRIRCICTATTSGTPGNISRRSTRCKTWKAAGRTSPIRSTTPTAATAGTRCARKRRSWPNTSTRIPDITTDAGAVLFGDTVTITADGPWQHLLYKLTGRKWGNLDVENETGCGIVPYTYRPSNLVNAVQWAVGLELLLLINNPWQVFLSTDHPNGGCFWRYPRSSSC